jgi:hypothetical protein
MNPIVHPCIGGCEAGQSKTSQWNGHLEVTGNEAWQQIDDAAIEYIADDQTAYG